LISGAAVSGLLSPRRAGWRGCSHSSGEELSLGAAASTPEKVSSPRPAASRSLAWALPLAVEDEFRVVDEGDAMGLGELLGARSDEVDVGAVFEDEAGGLDGIAEALDTVRGWA
jgi:hypothetical protein